MDKETFIVKLKSRRIRIETEEGIVNAIVLKPRAYDRKVPGILWIHGGGYMTGMAAMVHVTEGKSLAKRYGAVVVSPEYRLAKKAPYPAALNDCFAALRYMYDNSEELGIDRSRIIIGGESAGGGLAAALCMYARDKSDIKVFMQIPLYPMLDCFDTPSSSDNHGLFWDTRRNHWGWSHYLGPLYGKQDIPQYASPSRETDYSNLPPAYTFITDGEAFYDETMTYIKNLNDAGIPSHVDVFHGNFHAFDFLFWTRNAKEARRRLYEYYGKMMSEIR